MVHVQSCCFANQTYCFLTFALPFASFDLKVPSHPLRRHWERYDPLLVLFEHHRHVSPLSIYSGSLLCVIRVLTIRQRRRPFRRRWKLPFSSFHTILTAYIISASRSLSYILRIPPCSASSGQVWCFAVSLLKFSCFASIVVILPAFRWRKLLLPHPPPLVPVDAATLNSRCIP